MRRIAKRLWHGVLAFFFPPAHSSFSRRALPYMALGVVSLSALTGGLYAWDYTNSPTFCGTQCHTMPPEYSSYQVSPHARIACVECHIGREFVGNQIIRKAGDVKHIIALAFEDYEFPITAHDMRPARETCERCHSPEKFADDSLREIVQYGNDPANTPTSIYLLLKTGGGSEREGLGRGIHWHIENRLMYYAADDRDQTIPYVRVYTGEDTYEEFIDLTSGLTPADVPEDELEEMDCITCHNRITHLVSMPEDAVDRLLTRGLIDAAIPEIRLKAVEVLWAPYDTVELGVNGIAGLTNYYTAVYPDYYAANAAKIEAAIVELQNVYRNSVFPEQKADWTSHPNNLGHQYSPGCFRCHDGKHLNAADEAIRLECNLCHAIPVVAGAEDFVTDIEISRGLEPESHLNANWLVRHRTYLDRTCSACHDTSNPGGTDNSSFCSNSACHGSSWTYAGLDAPGLAEIAAAQMPIPTEPPPPPVVDVPSYMTNILPLFEAVCLPCHGDKQAGGLTLTTYAGALAGGEDGPVIVPGDVEGSLLIQVQVERHFANFSDEELALVSEWIAAGAPE